MNEDQSIQNIDILIDLWKPYTHGGHSENDWDIFEILFQEATGRFVFTEHNTNSYNDVHLCRKAQTTASNRQYDLSILVYWCRPYTQTGYIAGLYENAMSAVLVQGPTG